MEYSLLEGLTARDCARILFKRKVSILLIFLISVIMVAGYTYLVLPTYEAAATVLLVAEKSPPMPMAEKLTPYRQGIEVGATYSAIIKSNAVVADVVKALALHERPDPKGLRGFIAVKIELFEEWFSDVKRDLKSVVVTLFTGRRPEGSPKPTKFEKQIDRLSSKKVVRIDPLERTDVITIKVRDYDPQTAAKIANAFAQALIVYSAEMELQDLNRLYRSEHPRIIALEREIEELRAEMSKPSLEAFEELAGKASSGEIKILEKATPPFAPVAPRKKLNILVAVVIGLAAGVFYAFLLEVLDRTIKVPLDVAEVLKTRTLASIPVGENGSANKNSDWRSLGASVNPIASELFLAKVEKGIKCIMVVSANSKDGKTTLTFNLAEALAQKTRGKILVVGADLRNPFSTQTFRSTPCLADFATQNLSWQDLVQEVPSKGFSVVFGGFRLEHPETLLTSKSVLEFFRNVKQHFDFVLVDTPDLRRFKDALSFSGVVDGAIFVVNANETRKFLAHSCAASLQEKKIPIIGAVLNFRKFEIPESIYSKI